MRVVRTHQLSESLAGDHPVTAARTTIVISDPGQTKKTLVECTQCPGIFAINDDPAEIELRSYVVHSNYLFMLLIDDPSWGMRDHPK